jgi:MATE family multidrug resistance protein
MLTALRDPQAHTKLLSIAVPLILANITTPLLGLVDTAILGRMNGIHYLAGAAIGSLILTQLYWVCGFIKMSMTGLSAQSHSKDMLARSKILIQGCALAAVLAVIILLIQTPFLQAGLWFAQAEPEVVQSTEHYFYVRVWGAPAALINLAIIGWLIGQQKGRLILALQLAVNLLNIGASLSFVYWFDMGVKGVAAGTLVAEYGMTLMALYWINRRYVRLTALKKWFYLQSIKPLLSLNSDMLVRNLALQFTLAFIILKGAQFGTQATAINAILMQFFALIALGLDGIANAVEALVGELKGKKDRAKRYWQDIGEISLSDQVMLGIFYSSMTALLYTLIFWFAGASVVALLTDQQILIDAALEYQWVILLLPLIAHWCFLFDGVYVGLTQGKIMRNNMLISTLFVFLPCYLLLSALGNQALWLAMFAFLAARGIGLGAHFWWAVVPKQNQTLS